MSRELGFFHFLPLWTSRFPLFSDFAQFSHFVGNLTEIDLSNFRFFAKS